MDQLSLRLECADLHATLRIPKRHNSPDILGAIFFDRDAILIDESLNPETDPARLGRYRYSAGHEIAHWWLHRSTVLKYLARKRQQSRLQREIDRHQRADESFMDDGSGFSNWRGMPKSCSNVKNRARSVDC